MTHIEGIVIHVIGQKQKAIPWGMRGMNTINNKPMNHLGKNTIDRALAWMSKITRISPFIIRLIIFASVITLTVLI